MKLSLIHEARKLPPRSRQDIDESWLSNLGRGAVTAGALAVGAAGYGGGTAQAAEPTAAKFSQDKTKASVTLTVPWNEHSITNMAEKIKEVQKEMDDQIREDIKNGPNPDFLKTGMYVPTVTMSHKGKNVTVTGKNLGLLMPDNSAKRSDVSMTFNFGFTYYQNRDRVNTPQNPPMTSFDVARLFK